MSFFSVGWAAFDDFELIADIKDEECAIKPPEAVPHVPSLGDCTFQHSLCDWNSNKKEGFSFKRITGNDTSEHEKPSFDHFGDPYGESWTSFFVWTY